MSYELGDEREPRMNWSDFQRWDELFRVVMDNGQYSATGDLAAEICSETAREKQGDLEAVIRNITNWRNGTHVPSRRYFTLLTEVLSVKQNPELLKVWNRLYNQEIKRKSRSKPGSGSTTEDSPASLTESKSGSFWRQSNTILAAFLVIVIGTAILWVSNSNDGSGNASTNKIPFQPDLVLEIGESATLHGYRSKCGRGVPSVQETESLLPRDLKHGVLSAGEAGVRYSRTCQDFTPARAVRYQAKSKGIDRFRLFGDEMTVTVSE